MQETKRSANGSSPMMSEGRFDLVLQSPLKEFNECEAREREYYAAERDEFGFEDQARKSARRLEFPNATKNKKRK
jgi:hypothetical protein